MAIVRVPGYHMTKAGGKKMLMARLQTGARRCEGWQQEDARRLVQIAPMRLMCNSSAGAHELDIKREADMETEVEKMPPG